MLKQAKSQLDTPCLIIDKSKLLSNINSMQAFALATGVKIRPHIKTHKSIAICKLQLAAGAIGICAAKVSEAEVLAQHKIPGILITSPVVTPTKIVRLIACLKLCSDLIVVIDNRENAKLLNELLAAERLTLKVLIDINTGIGRTGVEFNEVLAFADFLNDLPHLQLCGLQCYAGFLQHIADYHERKQRSHQLMQQAAQVKQQLLAAGFNCEILSGSGTGTYEIDSEVAGVTEVQPGSYTVMDVEYRVIAANKQQTLAQVFQPAMTY